jgi:ribosomal protein L11 methyltransferase
MSYSLVVTPAEADLELCAALLAELGALGVEVQEPGMLLMPGTPPLPEGRGRCIAHFDERSQAEEAAAGLADELPQLEVPPPLEVEAQEWSVAWRVFHKAMKVGPRSWVHPPWEKPEAAPGEVCVSIDPGMAFGTGSHPTTSLCLERVDELLAERPGSDLLDVGTGSGVIALLAARLGAARICGTENDPVALVVAREGAAANGLAEGRIAWELCDCDQLPAPYHRPYGIVVANILLNTLVLLAPQIARKVAPGGALVLAGLLAHQGDEAEAAYLAQGLLPHARKEQAGWVRVELRAAR